jgi:hypothetical protein
VRKKYPPMSHGFKICDECGETKSHIDYPANQHSWDGRGPRCKPCAKRVVTRRKHGMTREEREATAAAQGGCLICRRTQPGGKGWVMDHDHSCCPGERSCPKCRRGLLCQWCNTALGYAMDNPEILRRMADYLERHRESLAPIGSTDRSTDRTEKTDGLTKSDNRLGIGVALEVTRAERPEK